MILTFYSTGFDVSKNGIYESIEAYLQSLTPTLSISDYKHIDPSLNVSVKLPVESRNFLKSKIGDYCRAQDNGGTYYYYVMGCDWKGKETVAVSLALDTLNTFALRIKECITAETHVSRKFKNRYGCRGSSPSRGTLWPVIDRTPEEFSTMPMERKSVTAINPTASERKWTLVYLTEYTSDTELKNNPVTCRIFPSSAVTVATGTSGSVTWSSSHFSSNRAFAFSSSDNPEGVALTIGSTTITTSSWKETLSWSIYVLWSATYSKYYIKRIVSNYNAGTGTPVSTFSEWEGTSITFSKAGEIYEQEFDYADGLNSSTSKEAYPQAGKLDYSRPVQLNAGATYSALTAFSSWYALNKTDARIIKIRELPYAPFNEAYDSSGQLTIPTGWIVEDGWLKFTGTSFGARSLATRALTMPTITADDIVESEPSIDRETKLYNSAFYSDKLVYDTASWVAEWENYHGSSYGAGAILNGSMNVAIEYAVSDGMDNGSLFHVTNKFEYGTDFGEYMVVDKSTDKPYFTSDYLNYLRFGKAVDEKAVGFNVASAAVSGVGGIATTAASLAFGASAAGFSGGAGAVIGAVVGTALAAISLSKTAATAWDGINSKIDTYTHQASSVSGTSDVSLFNVYSGNKLLNIIYQPRDEIRKMLFNYFRLYGYANDSYEIPTSTRRWVDYFKCEPVFQGDLLWNEFKDDIIQRMQVGYRVFHWVDGTYDLTLSKENWETKLWDWAH